MTTMGGAGRGDGLLRTVAALFPVALCVAVYFLFQSGSLTLAEVVPGSAGPPRA